MPPAPSSLTGLPRVAAQRLRSVVRAFPRPTAFVAAVFFVVVALMQWHAGAHQSEFGAFPDEPAHYVTGLLIHDYLVTGFPGNPMVFAQQFYDH